MDFIHRQYETADAYWRLRSFFRELQTTDTLSSEIWDVCEFDYWRWHTLESVWERPPHELRYWENAEGRIVAVLVQGDPGVCHPMADPEVATDNLLHEMLAVAESEFLTTLEDGRRMLFPWSGCNNHQLNSVLESRGYEPHVSGHATMYHGWRSLQEAPSSPETPAGYVLRSMGDLEEHPARSLASWRVFHPGEPDEGADPEGAWYRNVQRAPLYRRDLDVVAVHAATDDIAAFSTCYFDDVLRTGDILLSGAAQPHPVESLERAVVEETLVRLHHLGAVGCRLSWFESDPGAVYESAGFDAQFSSRAWRKAVS